MNRLYADNDLNQIKNMNKTKSLTAIILLAAFACIAATTNDPAPPGPPLAKQPASTNVFVKAANLVFEPLTRPWVAGPAPGEEWYNKGEFNLSLSPTYTAIGGSHFQDLWTSKFKQGTWGLNLGTMLWPSKYLGVGVDMGITDWNDVKGCLLDYLGADLQLRYPIGRLAPYVIGTVGRNFADGEYYSGAGAGVEYALTKRLRAFTDGRFIWQQHPEANALQIRAGLTFTF